MKALLKSMWNSWLFGWCLLIDGLVRILSFGYMALNLSDVYMSKKLDKVHERLSRLVNKHDKRE